ncbi:hypothetical protein [Lysobacter tyrosinilyticus]
MNPMTKWLSWAVALAAATCCIDFIVFNGATALRAGGGMLVLLLGYTMIGLAATTIFWRLGITADGGTRIAATVAFLLLQGLILALVSLMTLLTAEARA